MPGKYFSRTDDARSTFRAAFDLAKSSAASASQPEQLAHLGLVVAAEAHVAEGRDAEDTEDEEEDSEERDEVEERRDGLDQPLRHLLHAPHHLGPVLHGPSQRQADHDAQVLTRRDTRRRPLAQPPETRGKQAGRRRWVRKRKTSR
eukprot:1920283-Rhodomonas_salina.4